MVTREAIISSRQFLIVGQDLKTYSRAQFGSAGMRWCLAGTRCGFDYQQSKLVREGFEFVSQVRAAL